MAEEPYQGPDAPPAGSSDHTGRGRPTAASMRAELDELRRQVQQNDDEIDALQIAAAQAGQVSPLQFLRQPAVLISFLSLLLAFGTTFLSSQRLDQDRLHEQRSELTGYIARLADIPRRQAEIQQQHPGADAATLLAELNAEQQALALQARSVIQAIPDQVATVEYMAVGYSFQTSGALADAEALYQAGLDRAKSPTDRIIALRSLAYVRYLTADYSGGRTLYLKARHAYDGVTNVAQLIMANDNANTELQWAGAELFFGFCAEATEHANAAQELIGTQRLTNLTPLVQQLFVGISTCVPSQTPSPT